MSKGLCIRPVVVVNLDGVEVLGITSFSKISKLTVRRHLGIMTGR